MGRSFVRGYGTAHLGVALVLAAPFLVPCPPGALVAVPGGILLGALLAWVFNRRLGGVNGDVLGGTEVLGELLALWALLL